MPIFGKIACISKVIEIFQVKDGSGGWGGLGVGGGEKDKSRNKNWIQRVKIRCDIRYCPLWVFPLGWPLEIVYKIIS